MKFFSDEEHTNMGPISSLISIDVWNGIAGLINALIGKSLLAKDFPRQCPDGNGICGVDEQKFYISAIASIPKIKNLLPGYGEIPYLPQNALELPFLTEEEKRIQKENFTYAILDFIQFVFNHISDTQNGPYHEFFKHYELKFPNTTHEKNNFLSKINAIFERNHIGFKLCENGCIQRIVNDVLLHPLKTQNLESKLEELIKEAITRFKSPYINERKIAIEKLWDAFERLKTINKPNHKIQSVNILLSNISQENTSFKMLLDEECKSLTNIGNTFQIRHFETQKVPITSDKHLDYLFYRLYSLISLLTTSWHSENVNHNQS